MRYKKPDLSIDRSRWSESSRRSCGFRHTGPDYRDVEYVCRKCGERDVYTAQAQKIDYESRQVYIWQRRILCSKCFDEAERAKRDVRAFEKEWRANREFLQKDATRLQRWLHLLEILPAYGIRRDEGNICMLRKRLAAYVDDQV